MSKKLTTEEFIEKAKLVHGDKYDYSETIYNGLSSKLKIICPIHNEHFEQLANNHLHGATCPKCSGHLMNTNYFIEKSKKIHGNRFDYSKSKYIDSITKVCIICPEHGEFWQLINSHLNGNGCVKCSGKHKKTNEEFITEAKLLYGDVYDYSKTEYVNSHTKIEIICAIHGSFYTTPISHLSNVGCQKCGIINAAKKRTISTELFIKKSKVIHGDKFDYSLVNYKNSGVKIKLICPEHGEFEQLPSDNLQNHGCPKCAGKYMDTDFFIEKSKKIHENKYDYSMSEYINSVTKIKIICPIHGEFEQMPSSHLNGHGCSKCSGKHRKTTDEFINNSNIIHNYKYDYSKTNFISSISKIKIICPEHGEFEQNPSSHLNGIGCPDCGGSKKLTLISFIKKANIIHENKYDYSISEYINSITKIKIICPIHGEFEQVPSSHLQKIGCPKCSGRGFIYLPFQQAREFIRNLNFKNNKEWIEYCNSGLKPDNIPNHPEIIYKKP